MLQPNHKGTHTLTLKPIFGAGVLGRGAGWIGTTSEHSVEKRSLLILHSTGECGKHAGPKRHRERA